MFVQRAIGVYQLAWWLRKHRLRVQVVDYIFLLSADQLVELTLPFISKDTLCIAVSPAFWPSDSTIPSHITDALAKIRQKFPHVKFVAGGPRMGKSEEFDSNFDATFTGDGEDVFLKWCQEQRSGVALPNQLFNITTLEHRFIQDDVIVPGEMLPIELGRGCIFRCKFCGHDKLGKKKGTYLRDIHLVREEMAYNFDAFGTTKYIYVDDTVNDDEDKVRHLSELPRDLGFDLRWVGYCRADLIWSRDGEADLLRQSGLISPFFGVETFHDEAARSIGKGWSSKHAQDWLPKLHEQWNHEVNFRISMILGLPKEPVSSFFDTLRWFKGQDLGQILFFPLGLRMTGSSQGADFSIFERNAHEYGYDVGADGNWKNGTMTYEFCKTLADRFNDTLVPSNRLAAFQLATSMNVLGYFETKKYVPEVRKLIDVNTSAFVQRYITQYKKHFGL